MSRLARSAIRFSWWLSGAFCGAAAALSLANGPVVRAEPAGTTTLRPLEPNAARGSATREVELAPYMGGLQRLTHKLALSVDAGNVQLASFYTYEALEVVGDIEAEVPVYKGLQVAALIDANARPPLEAMKRLLAQRGKPDRAAMTAALGQIVQGCNACHGATQHAFIRITAETTSNPFNQDFKPL